MKEDLFDKGLAKRKATLGAERGEKHPPLPTLSPGPSRRR